MKKAVGAMPYLLILAVFLSSVSGAIGATGDGSIREASLTPYDHLSQIIEKEAVLFSEYSVYQKDLRVQAFWEQVEVLSQKREEIIQKIRLLETKRGEEIDAGVLPSSTDARFVSLSGAGRAAPGGLSRLLPFWKEFYYATSVIFLLVSFAMLIFVCRDNFISFIINRLTSEASYPCCDADLIRKKAK